MLLTNDNESMYESFFFNTQLYYLYTFVFGREINIIAIFFSKFCSDSGHKNMHNTIVGFSRDFDSYRICAQPFFRQACTAI